MGQEIRFVLLEELIGLLRAYAPVLVGAIEILF